MDLYDYKPKMNEWYDKDLPDSVRMGQRLTTMTSRPDAVPDRAVEVQVRPARQVRHVGQRAAAVHGQDGRRHVLHPQHAHRGDQPRAGHHLHADRQPGHRPALPRVAGSPTASARSTRTCRRSSCWSPSRRNTEQVQAISARLWSSGYLPGEHAGVSFRTGGDPILYINNPPGVPAEVRRNTLDGLQRAQRDELPARRRPRDAHAHPAVRTGLPHAGERARADRHRRTSRSRPTRSTATRPRSPAPSPTRRCWPGGWSSAACASCRSTTTTGTRTPTSPAGCPTSAATSIRPATGLIQDLKRAACSTRRWSSGAASSAARSTRRAA